MEEKRLEMLKQLAAGIAAQFGSNCEVVIHDVSSNHPDHSIVHIENGHVSGRKVGDGASQVVLDQMASQAEHPQDHLCYLTRTPDGKILKSSTQMCIRDSSDTGQVTALIDGGESIVVVGQALGMGADAGGVAELDVLELLGGLDHVGLVAKAIGKDDVARCV